ncbi:MAG: hypothetical protein AAF716_01685 [Cyanobacteria bacterium P01_D01_bin.1]
MFRYFRRKANRRKTNRRKADPSPPAIYINTHRHNQDSEHIANIIGSDSDVFSEFKVLTTDEIEQKGDEFKEEKDTKIQPNRKILFWAVLTGLVIGGSAVLIFQTG